MNLNIFTSLAAVDEELAKFEERENDEVPEPREPEGWPERNEMEQS